MTTTEVLRVQLDNVQHELHLLQVENNKLRAEAEEQSAEIEDLRQRLLDSEEKVIGAEQEVELCQCETEKLTSALTGIKEEYAGIEVTQGRVVEEGQFSRAAEEYWK